MAIPTNKRAVAIQSTIDGQVIKMDIAKDAIQHIIGLLTDAYSDPEYAVIREIGTNALDAHVAAGNPLPIEVYTPTPLAPFLRIKDYGVGLNAGDIEEIYSQYGASTKRTTNEQTGELGVGGKSPLTYTHQFTVVAVKDGTKTTVSVSRDEDGVGTMTIVSEDPSDEGNGVEIIIPAKTPNSFEEKAKFLFKYWPEGSVKLNGEEPERIDGLKVTDDIMLVRAPERSYYDEAATPDYIVMGNVPYPVDNNQFNFGLPDSYHLVAFVPNGSAHFPLSREALTYTKRTKETLEGIHERLQGGLLDAINKEIDAATSMHEALSVALQWRSSLGDALRGMTFNYRQIDIPDSIEASQDGEIFILSDGARQEDWYGKPTKVGYHSRTSAVDLSVLSDAIWVYGFQRTFSPTVKKKLWHYLDTQGQSYPRTFIMCGTKPDSPWIDPAQVIAWAPIEAIKLPRISQSTGRNITGRLAGSYDAWLNVGQGADFIEEVPADDIDTDMPLYFHILESSRDRYSTTDKGDSKAALLSKIEDEFMIVLMTVNRREKFQRLFPEARELGEALREYSREWRDMLSTRDCMLLNATQLSSLKASLSKLPDFGIADPVVASLKRLFKDAESPYARHLATMLDAWRPVGQPSLPDGDITNPFDDRYPLFEGDSYNYRFRGNSRSQQRKHNLIYINAVYNALYKETE